MRQYTAACQKVVFRNELRAGPEPVRPRVTRRVSSDRSPAGGHEDAECTHLFRSARQLGARGVEGDGSQRPLMGSNGADRFLSVKRQDGH